MDLLDVVDSALLVRGGLPAEGEAQGQPAPVPGGVRWEPAGAARHMTEMEWRLELRHRVCPAYWADLLTRLSLPDKTRGVSTWIFPSLTWSEQSDEALETPQHVEANYIQMYSVVTVKIFLWYCSQPINFFCNKSRKFYLPNRNYMIPATLIGNVKLFVDRNGPS